jgi:hypothetical protein
MDVTISVVSATGIIFVTCTFSSSHWFQHLLSHTVEHKVQTRGFSRQSNCVLNPHLDVVELICSFNLRGWEVTVKFRPNMTTELKFLFVKKANGEDLSLTSCFMPNHLFRRH